MGTFDIRLSKDPFVPLSILAATHATRGFPTHTQRRPHLWAPGWALVNINTLSSISWSTWADFLNSISHHITARRPCRHHNVDCVSVQSTQVQTFDTTKRQVNTGLLDYLSALSAASLTMDRENSSKTCKLKEWIYVCSDKISWLYRKYSKINSIWGFFVCLP